MRAEIRRYKFVPSSTKLLVIILLFTGLNACTTVDVSVVSNDSADIAEHTTYAWATDPEQSTGEPLLDDPELHSVIQSSIDHDLGSKGYKKVVAGGDFLVHYSVLLEPNIEIITQDDYQDYPVIYGWNMGFVPHKRLEDGTMTYVRQYQEGTLIIDVIEPKKERLLWRGSASAEIQRTASTERRRERAKKAIRDTLESFPVPRQ